MIGTWLIAEELDDGDIVVVSWCDDFEDARKWATETAKHTPRESTYYLLQHTHTCRSVKTIHFDHARREPGLTVES